MSVSIAIHHPGRYLLEQVSHHVVLSSFLLGLTIAVATYALAGVTQDYIRSVPELAASTRPPPPPPATTHELPPEWQWEQPGVQVEHMWRTGPSADPDFIRSTRRR